MMLILGIIFNFNIEAAVFDRLSKEPYQETTLNLINGILPKDLNQLAIVVGKLDFTKTLNEPKAVKIPEKWYALLYWFELKVSGKEPPKGVDGTFIKSELKKIGAIKCNSTGLSFYNSFKEIEINNSKFLSKIFGNTWQEHVKKLSNNNLEIIKYIDENY